jgi:hypothetical protein
MNVCGRELSFRRGDIIFVRRQIDKNWFEGEHNAMIGLFPFNYVEVTVPVENSGFNMNLFYCVQTEM